ncbi:MAG: GNAT family N-acetyltransferase [Rikenellaceae bacterium]
MLTRERISTQENPLFPLCWGLYESAFPLEERRAHDYHIETLERPNYHFEAILDQSQPIGFIGWWDLNEMVYIEHFATSPTLRGGGYGGRVLQQFIEQMQRPIILEVEHPTDNISQRRIGFYQRLGFQLNQHPYSHPSYQQPSDERVSLMIMTHPAEVSYEQLENFSHNHIPLIHFRSR